MNEWISVDERLPGADEIFRWSANVLVYTPKTGVTIAEFDRDNDEWLRESTGDVIAGVSHWMPLPKPPERGK